VNAGASVEALVRGEFPLSRGNLKVPVVALHLLKRAGGAAVRADGQRGWRKDRQTPRCGKSTACTIPAADPRPPSLSYNPVILTVDFEEDWLRADATRHQLAVLTAPDEGHTMSRPIPARGDRGCKARPAGGGTSGTVSWSPCF